MYLYPEEYMLNILSCGLLTQQKTKSNSSTDLSFLLQDEYFSTSSFPGCDVCKHTHTFGAAKMEGGRSVGSRH